jgi:cob(I)alamin adenosyltransferase
MLINPRIKARSKFGSGDNGLTATSCCKRNSKYHSIEVDIDETLEDLRLSISRILYNSLVTLNPNPNHNPNSNPNPNLSYHSNPNLNSNSINSIKSYNVSHELRSVLEWLYNNSFSIGAFVYTYKKDIKNRHSFKEEDLNRVESTCLSLRSELGDCQDFLLHKETYFSQLDAIRVNVRKLERQYHGWIGYENHEVSPLLKLQVSMLNRLSDLLFWLIRREYKINGVHEIYWQGYMQPIDLG